MMENRKHNHEIIELYQDYYMMENRKHNHEIIELQQEDSKAELQEIEFTIQKVERLKDEVKPNTTAEQEIDLFLTRLNTQKEFCKAIVDENEQSLSMIEDYILEQAREDYYIQKELEQNREGITE